MGVVNFNLVGAVVYKLRLFSVKFMRYIGNVVWKDL